MLYPIFSTGILFFVYCGSNFDGRKDLTFYRFRVIIQTTKNSSNGGLFGEYFYDHISSHSHFRNTWKQWRQEAQRASDFQTKGLQSA